MSDMETTLRNFQRNFRAIKDAAAKGHSVIIAARSGERYLFQKLQEPASKTFGEIAGRHAGSVSSGIGDLSSNKKHLRDFGRARSSR
jgi:hypothetical protein